MVQSILDKVLLGVNKFKIETTSDLHRYTKKDLIIPVTGGDSSSAVKPDYEATGNMLKYQFVDFKNSFINIKSYFEPIALEQGISQNNLSSIGCAYVATKPQDS